MSEAELAARLAALEAKIDALTSLVERLGDPGVPGAAPPAATDETWRRLGLAEGERRIVTVLFADVSGFTALSEQLDPEAVQLVLRDTMSELAACVAAEGGTVEKFIGDAVCAIFGAPVAYPDEPERAARAALAMHEAMARRVSSRPDLPPLRVHAGINTGPVIAGAVGDGSQFGVMGDTINTAARLMDLAADAETFVSAATARRLRRRFRLEDRGLHEAKGKAKPLAAFALLGSLDGTDGRGDEGAALPLVGRATELARLHDAARRAAAGEGRTVVLRGDDGVGTSRLAEHVAEVLASEGWTVLGASARVHAETPLGLVASALGPLLAEPAGDLAGGAAGPLAGTLLSGDAAAPHDFELVLGEVVQEAARRQPLVVVIDDADGADPGSIEVLRYLSRATADDRVLWVLAANEVPAPFEPGIAAGDVDVVPVEPLDDAAVAELYDSLLPGALTPAQRERLAHLAEGNPQFAREIALALIDDGVVVEAADGRWVAVGDVDACELPGSVAELVEARIDQLSTAARRTLQEASVIGLRFSRRLLERVATVPAALDAALAELVADDLVVPASGAGGLWAFRSRLVREVAYGSLLRRHRPAAHRAVADALAALEPEHLADNADLLAHHFEESDDPPLALPHLLVAVERAELACNLTGLLERARRGLKLRDRFPGRISEVDAATLLKRAGIAKLLLGDASGHDELEAAVAAARAAGAPASELAVLAERVGWYLTVDRQCDAAEVHLAEAERLAGALDAEPARAAVLTGIAVTRSFAAGALGDVADARAVAEAALAAARDTDDRFVEARAGLVAGALALWDGDASDAVGRLEDALAVARAEHHATIADRCGRWLVAALVEIGDQAAAEALALPILARVDDRGDPTVAAGIRAALALGRREAGDRAGATVVAHEAEALAAGHRLAPEVVADTHLALALLAVDAAEAPGDDDGHRAVHVHEARAHLGAATAAHRDEPWLAWRSASRVAPADAAVARVEGGPASPRVTVPR